MKYYYEMKDTVLLDELLAGSEQNTSIINVEVESGTAIARGTILAAEKFGDKFAPITAADTEKVLVVSTYDTNESDSVIPVYSQGKFHREKLIFDSALNLDDFENTLRMQNIILTSLH